MTLSEKTNERSFMGADFALAYEASAERLRPYPGCEARVMDGEQLDLPDGSFDAAFSIFGAIVFSDWQRGLGELARVVRPGGHGCVAAWRDPPGGGPFVLLAQALRAVFPERPSPPPSEAMRALSSPDALQAEMRAAGFNDIALEATERVWVSPAGKDHLAETADLYSYIKPYARLDAAGRDLVQAKLIELAGQNMVDGRVELHSTALIAVGRRL